LFDPAPESFNPTHPSGDLLWRFYLLPPDYRKKAFDRFHLPAYAYDSKSMIKLANELFVFSHFQNETFFWKADSDFYGQTARPFFLGGLSGASD
jgi:hypothetical protein